uniref:Bardet-Biedl syndrome 10 protein homolog n=1 Tax=Acanthochromis polyacanthus TaxID=80966 RepID=A0A3Q1ETU2_9TELE
MCSFFCPFMSHGSVVGVLEAVILRSFGPEGGQVLFTRDTGQAMLSRSGTHILRALHLEHPLARMVVECVWKHSTVTGDGSKTFILLLASLLRKIHTTASREPHVSHSYNSLEAAEAATARHLADKLLAFALKELDDLIAMEVAPHGRCVSWEDFTAEMHSPANHYVQKLLASFFHMRLGYVHCAFISELTCELLNHWKCIDNLPYFALQFLKDNFPAIHTPVSGFPITSSRLIEGQVIHRDFATPYPQTDHQPIKAVVFTGYLQPRLLNTGDVLEVGCGGTEERSIVDFSAWTERSLQCLIANLQSLGVSVLLSVVKQSAAVLALATQAEMCFVDCVSEDELSLFAQLSGATPISDCWRIEPEHIAELTFCRPILLGPHRYENMPFFSLTCKATHLHAKNYLGTIHTSHLQTLVADVFIIRVKVKPYSLIICGSGEGQTDQYACAFQDAIRMLFTTWEPIPATGTTAAKRTVQSDKRTSSYTHVLTDSSTCTSSNLNPLHKCVLQPGCIMPAGGTFEFLLHHALLKLSHSCSASNDTNIGVPVSRLLASALLSVPKQIYSHSPGQFLQTRTRHNAIFTQDMGLESVSCKYELLLAVLQCVTSLLRVDTILRTHTALHTQSLADTSWESTEDEAEN